MRIRKSRRRARSAAPPGPKLAEHAWHGKSSELADTGTLTMARRLPALIGQVMRLAWRAARRPPRADGRGRALRRPLRPPA